MIIYATGFDAITGGFDRIDIRGRDGRRLKEKWEDGPQTYLGLQSEGFPNLLTLIGPHNAATFCNMPRCIEQNVDWVTDLLVLHARARDSPGSRPSPPPSAPGPRTRTRPRRGSWLSQVDSWMTRVNQNVAGHQKRTFVAYAGGAPKYRQRCDEVAARGYEGFELA